jgi:hypothetical protein
VGEDVDGLVVEVGERLEAVPLARLDRPVPRVHVLIVLQREGGGVRNPRLLL